MLVILSTGILALVISSLLARKHDSTLYCTSNTSPSSIVTFHVPSNRAEEVVKCFRVQEGIFTEVLESEPNVKWGEKITYIDGFVLPGIIESHGHILQYGEMLESVSLYGAESVAEIRFRIKEYLDAHDGEGYGSREKFIRGIGWDQKYFGGVMPTAVCFQAILHG